MDSNDQYYVSRSLAHALSRIYLCEALLMLYPEYTCMQITPMHVMDNLVTTSLNPKPHNVYSTPNHILILSFHAKPVSFKTNQNAYSKHEEVGKGAKSVPIKQKTCPLECNDHALSRIQSYGMTIPTSRSHHNPPNRMRVM